LFLVFLPYNSLLFNAEGVSGNFVEFANFCKRSQVPFTKGAV